MWNKIEPSQLEPKYKWIATDRDGRRAAYTHEPLWMPTAGHYKASEGEVVELTHAPVNEKRGELIQVQSHMTEEMQELIKNFTEEFKRNMEAARSSGATGDMTEMELTKYVFVITADGFAPYNKAGKAKLENLRHFI